MVTSLWYTQVYNLDFLSLFWRRKEYPHPLSPDYGGLLKMVEVPDWGLASGFWLGYGHWSLVHPCSKFWLPILILKMQRTSMSFKFLFPALEDAGGYRFGFCILVLIWILSLFLDRFTFWILTVYHGFEGVKDIHVLTFQIWGLGGCLRLLTGVWHLHVALDMVSSLWYTHDPNFGSLSRFWRCKEHPCPLSPHLELWRMLEVPDWGLASWSWFGYGHWSLIHPGS